jgi:uncharacterized protein YodC (DUF2158 family)
MGRNASRVMVNRMQRCHWFQRMIVKHVFYDLQWLDFISSDGG